MNTELLQQSRLDVKNKSRSNIFNWRGQFTPQFIEYLLDQFAFPDSVVVDPFCGSGTVLLESASKELHSAGFEINPAAYAMARFIALAGLRAEERANLWLKVSKTIARVSSCGSNVPLFEPSGDYRHRCRHLLELATELFSAFRDKRSLLLALVIMMRTEDSKCSKLNDAVAKACSSVENDLLNLPFAEAEIEVYLCDARHSYKKYDATVDLMVTSPPYINVFNYHQNYRALLEVLGFNVLKVAESEIGSNRKNRANRFRTVVQYALDMEQCLVSVSKTLKKSGTLILVVGHESNVRGIAFSNSALLKEIALALRCFVLDGERHRVFVNRFGNRIREDILVIRNLGLVPCEGSARQIAEKHLRESLLKATGAPMDDITDVLENIVLIESSPLFSSKDII
jgi:hypothetical protein